MRPSNFNVHVLIYDLLGTSSTIENNLPDGMVLEDLTTEDHATIDDEIYLCAECGWWSEVGEACH